MTLLDIQDLHKTFGRGADAIPAVRGVDLQLERGETLGLVGESGCGKTTLGRILVGLNVPTSGRVLFDGQDVVGRLNESQYRARVQMVFQHPQASLNPRFRVASTLSEPAKLLAANSDSEKISEAIAETLRLVGLGQEYLTRKSGQLSGGQQQRVAIARALMSAPDLIVLDEPTSSLDQSIRSRIISLLKDIQETKAVAYLFISHDLSTVRKIAHRVAVMYLGRIVEVSETNELFDDPKHPYTKALLAAVPSLDSNDRSERIILRGETPSPTELPVGCSFQDRCDLVHDRCRTQRPELAEVGPSHQVECFATQ
ncbi:MAG: ATP-binding cassette domain-containing protein [Gemmatimonadales bacterium]|nr:ATP-binding cassette domain-containing protein [Gemmatimonadales bacterium]